MRPQDVPRALLRQLIVPKAPMGQGVHRTQTENHPIRPLETAEELEQLLDWHHLIRFGEETKKTLGSLEMDGNSLFPTRLDRDEWHKVCLCSHLLP